MHASLMASTRPAALAPRPARLAARPASPSLRLPSMRSVCAEPAPAAAEAPATTAVALAPAAAVAAPADTKVEVAKGDRFRVYKAMLDEGWPKTWCDIVLDKMIKADIDTTAEQFQRLSAFLKLIGIQPLDFCFMAAVAPGIMGLTAEHASGVAKYVVRAGARSAGSLATVLRDHPKLLEYTHDPEQGVLVKAAGKGGVGGEAAKAAIQHTPDGKIGVSFWRDGCRWNTAPVSPFKPMRLPPGPP